MSGKELDFLEDKEPEEVDASEPEVEEPEVVAEEPEEATGEEPEPEADPEPEGEPPAPEPEAQRIPLTAMLDEREKRQKAERELEEMRRYIAQARQQNQERVPDFYEDADARLNYERQRWEQQTQAQRLQTSQFLAEREFGSDMVKEAYEFFDQPENRWMTKQFASHPSPYHAAVEAYKKQKFIQEVDDPDKWREAERERLRQEILAEAATPQKPKSPPPSMASAPARGTDAIQPGNAFDGLFD